MTDDEQLTAAIVKIKALNDSSISAKIEEITTDGIIAARDKIPGVVSQHAILLHGNDWGTMVGDQSFVNLFDPCTEYATVAKGHLGTLLGMPVFTDGFFDPDQKFLTESRIVYHGDI